MSQSSGGAGASTRIPRTASGMSPGRRHAHASLYAFPFERSEAASAFTSNCG